MVGAGVSTAFGTNGGGCPNVAYCQGEKPIRAW